MTSPPAFSISSLTPSAPGAFPDSCCLLMMAIQRPGRLLDRRDLPRHVEEHRASCGPMAIRKLGKSIDEPTSYRPVSLLCCCYKLLERLLLTRLAPIFESVISPEQAGFRKKLNTCDQVLALTSYIESGFQKKLKTGAVLIDLSAAYDTVWQTVLMMKLSKAIKCRTTIRLIASLISQRNFRVFIGCVPITSCKRCARLSQLCKPFHSRSHWEFPICTSGEVETVFLSQFAPLGKRWRRLSENLLLSLFNFNFVQPALVPGTRGLPMHRHCWCGGLLVGKRVQEVWEKKRKKGETN